MNKMDEEIIKTLPVSPRNHRRIWDVKLDCNFKTIDAVINWLFSKITELDNVVNTFKEYFKFLPEDKQKELKEELKNGIN